MEIHLSIKRGSVHVHFMNIAHHQSDNRRKYVISSKIRKLFLYSQEPCRDSTLNSTVNVARFTTPRRCLLWTSLYIYTNTNVFRTNKCAWMWTQKNAPLHLADIILCCLETKWRRSTQTMSTCVSNIYIKLWTSYYTAWLQTKGMWPMGLTVDI